MTKLGRLTFISGGARSGKSQAAQQLLQNSTIPLLQHKCESGDKEGIALRQCQSCDTLVAHVSSQVADPV